MELDGQIKCKKCGFVKDLNLRLWESEVRNGDDDENCKEERASIQPNMNDNTFFFGKDKIQIHTKVDDGNKKQSLKQ